MKTNDNLHFLRPEPSQPHSPIAKEIVTPKKKKGEDLCVSFLVAYRFLSIRISTSPMTIIATIVTIDIGRK